MSGAGYERLWGWFGLSYASWLTIPRVLMHQMPDEWQDQMAALLEEADATFPHAPDLRTLVLCRKDRKFIKPPSWVTNYRHPDIDTIETFRDREASNEKEARSVGEGS